MSAALERRRYQHAFNGQHVDLYPYYIHHLDHHLGQLSPVDTTTTSDDVMADSRRQNKVCQTHRPPLFLSIKALPNLSLAL